MKFVIKGSGAREHAIAWKLAESRNADEIICIGKNAGIETLCTCVDKYYPLPEDAIVLISDEIDDIPEKSAELPCFLSSGKLYPIAVVRIHGDRAETAPKENDACRLFETAGISFDAYPGAYGVVTLNFDKNDKFLSMNYGFGEFGAQALLPVLRGDMCKMLAQCRDGAEPEFKVINSCTVQRMSALNGQTVKGLSDLPGHIGVFINDCKYGDGRMIVTGKTPLYVAARGETKEKSAEAIASAEGILMFSD